MTGPGPRRLLGGFSQACFSLGSDSVHRGLMTSCRSALGGRLACLPTETLLGCSPMAFPLQRGAPCARPPPGRWLPPRDDSPFCRSSSAFLRTCGEALPCFGAGSFTPARRASDSPIAMAWFAERAPCFPSRMLCISCWTNSPAWVLGDFPSRASSWALSIASFSGSGIIPPSPGMGTIRNHRSANVTRRGLSGPISSSPGHSERSKKSSLQLQSHERSHCTRSGRKPGQWLE